MGQPWEAEHPVNQALAEALVAEQFPALAGPLTRLGQGWDNDMWRGEAAPGGEAITIGWRFPRRKMGVELLAVEASVLPALARLLPVSIPTPEWRGAPSPAFPYPFLGYRLLPGVTGDRAALTDAERLALAPALGRFLRALHDVDVEHAAALGVPGDTFRGDMPLAATIIQRHAAQVTGRWTDRLPAVRAAVAAAPPSDTTGRRVLLHGDLYARHLLLDDERAICGVIDWGDVSLGDPCKDLSILFSLLPAAARPAFLDAYGVVDDATARRARFIAIKYGVALLAYGADVGDLPLTAEGGRALDNALDNALDSALDSALDRPISD